MAITQLEDIGTAETYSTPAEWEDALAADLTAGIAGAWIGQLLGEAFTTQARLDGHTCDATHYYHLTSRVGNEHNGTAHEVSGAGNARIEHSGASAVLMYDDFTRFTWIEVKGPGNTQASVVFLANVGNCTLYVSHNIVHNNHASSGDERGINVNDASADARIYRNVSYGHGGPGIMTATAAPNSVCHCNTVYQSNHMNEGVYGGISTWDTDWSIKANACFDNLVGDVKDVDGTLDWNYTGDGTGDDEGVNGVANLVTADQFVAPTDTWADTDLLPKEGADLLAQMDSAARIAAFGASYLTDYPGIDEPINDRGNSISGDWDIGAGQLAVEEEGIEITATPATSAGAVPAASASVRLSPSAASSVGVAPAVKLQISISASVASSAAVVPAVSLSMRASASAASSAAVAPAVSLMQRLSPDPAVTTGGIPTPQLVFRANAAPATSAGAVPAVSLGNRLSPSPAASVGAVPAVSLNIRLSASAVASAAVAPAVSLGIRLSPSAVAITGIVPAATLIMRLSPEPLVIIAVAPAVTLVLAGIPRITYGMTTTATAPGALGPRGGIR